MLSRSRTQGLLLKILICELPMMLETGSKIRYWHFFVRGYYARFTSWFYSPNHLTSIKFKNTSNSVVVDYIKNKLMEADKYKLILNQFHLKVIHFSYLLIFIMIGNLNFLFSFIMCRVTKLVKLVYCSKIKRLLWKKIFIC